jgi:hypothetical protein
VSGFSAWLTPRELEAMAMYPWFVEAVPDKSYKLLSVETPMPQLSGDGEGVIIGLLDAGGVPSIPEAEGMPPPPAKWKGRCDHSKACNNNLIGPRSFVDTNRSQGTVMSSASGGSMHRVPSPGVVDYATAFAVAPKAHLAIYRVCDEVVCDPKAVAAGMDAAVDDSMDVVTLLIGNDEDKHGVPRRRRRFRRTRPSPGACWSARLPGAAGQTCTGWRATCWIDSNGRPTVRDSVSDPFDLAP